MDRPDKDSFPQVPEENFEQDDSGAQAQDVASDARVRSTDISEDSVRGGATNRAQIIPDDTPDLVERMNDMNRSGRIDMDAFAGEPQMDDEEESMGGTPDDEDEDGLSITDEEG
ncbi:MAG: hypothetical protein ABW164_10565 [Sphingobium sp.]